MRAWMVFLQVAGIAAGCTYYDTSLLAPAGSAGGGSAGAAGASGAAGSAGAAGGGTCQRVAPPNKPNVTGSGGTLDLVLAMRSIWFKGDADAGHEPVGYDIDRTCSCQGEGDSCQVPSWATGDHCDGPEGRDNAFGKLIDDMAAFSGVGEFGVKEWNERLSNGEWGVLIRVRNYNGEADDDEVELAWYMAEKLWAATVLDGGAKAPPKWDGSDAWPVRDMNVIGGDIDKPASADSKAYVSGGVLVGMLPSGLFQAAPSMQFILTDPYLTGRLVKGASGWELQEGQVAAVWQMTDVFEQFNYFTVLSQPMCKGGGNPFYDGVKQMICRHVDIFHDRGTPTSPCDSLSVGMAFSAQQAKFGPLMPTEVPEKLCDDAHDPATDTCGP